MQRIGMTRDPARRLPPSERPGRAPGQAPRALSHLPTVESAAVETVVLLFTDVEGSTRAWAYEPGDGSVARAPRRDLARCPGAATAGSSSSTPVTGCAPRFHQLLDAVLAAIDAQRALESADWGDGPALRVRVAIHAGTAHRRGDDWFGLSLSRCARLMGAAHGGQVLVSSAAGTLLAEAPAEGATVVDLGRVILRDFSEPEQVWQVVAPELNTEFPPLRAAAAEGNLPADLSPIIGRSEAIAQVCAAVPQSRLVTLTGAGGVGKTRLGGRRGADAGIRVRRRGLAGRARVRAGGRGGRPPGRRGPRA